MTDRVIISISPESVHRIVVELPEAIDMPIREAIELAIERGILQQSEVQIENLDLERAAKAAQP